MTKIEWISSQLEPNENPYLAVSRLNMPVAIPNPHPQGQVLAPVSLAQLAELVSPERMAKVIETNAYRLAVESFEKGDKESLRAYLPIIFHYLEEKEIAAIQKVLAESIPDPNWQRTMQQSLAEQAGYGLVTIDDVLQAQAN